MLRPSGPSLRIAALAAVALFYFAIPNARPDFSRFNCHDSESYLALGYNLAHGRGYTRSMISGVYFPHKVWAPGVPVLMVPATWLSGPTINWHAAKWTMALVGLAGIVFAWLLVRRLSNAYLPADLAGLAIACNPFYWDFSHQIMTEVPITVWLLGSLLLLDRLWANRKVRVLEALGVGLLCGMGMLIRGHVLGLALVPLAYFRGPRRTVLSFKSNVIRLCLYLLAFAIPHLCWMARNHFTQATGFDGIDQVRMVRAKNPVDPTSELLTSGETLEVMKRNLRSYAIYNLPAQIVPGMWSESAWEWPGSGWLALSLTLSLFLLSCPWRTEAIGIQLAIWPMVLLNLQYALGGSPRFWVPVSALLTVLLAMRISQVCEAKRLVLLAFVIPVFSLNLGWYVAEHEKHPYSHAGPWQELAGLFQRIAEERWATNGVLTPNPHALQLMSGYPAPMATDQLDPLYDHMIARLDGVGPQPPKDANPTLVYYPWAVFALARPTPLHQLLDPSKHPNGISVTP